MSLAGSSVRSERYFSASVTKGQKEKWECPVWGFWEVVDERLRWQAVCHFACLLTVFSFLHLADSVSYMSHRYAVMRIVHASTLARSDDCSRNTAEGSMMYKSACDIKKKQNSFKNLVVILHLH